MPVKDYNVSASLNTLVADIFIGPDAPRANMDNAIRQVMADIKLGVIQRDETDGTDIAFRATTGLKFSYNTAFDRYQVLFGRFSGMVGNQIHAGNNVYASQAGWKGFQALSNVITGVLPNTDPASGTTVTAMLSYAGGAQIIGNYVNGLTGGKDAETAYIYTKAHHGIVALNTLFAGQLTAGGGGTFYGINLKGSVRGNTATPQGYGAMALGNHAVGMGAVSNTAACQMQADEQAVIANNFDNWKRGLEFSGPITGSIVGLNRSYGAAVDKAMGGVVSGEVVLNVGNVSRNFIDGIEYSCAAADTLDRLSIIGQHHQGTAAGSGGAGLVVTGLGTGNVTNVLVADATFKSFSTGINFTQVYDATISNVRLTNITNADVTGTQRAYVFTNSKRIVGRNCQATSIQTTNATATAISEIQIADGNVICLRVRVCSRKSDGTAREVMEARCAGYMEGGAVTIGTATVTKEFATACNVTFLAATTRIRARVVGIAAETWDHFVTVDFEML